MDDTAVGETEIMLEMLELDDDIVWLAFAAAEKMKDEMSELELELDDSD